MRRVNVITALAWVGHAQASDLAANDLGDVRDSMKKSADKLADKLGDKFFERALKMPPFPTELDETTLDKTGHLMTPRQVISSPFISPLHLNPTLDGFASTLPKYQQQFRSRALPSKEKEALSSKEKVDTSLSDMKPTTSSSNMKFDSTKITEMNRIMGEALKGLPWWWKAFWQLDLPIMKRGKSGEDLTTGDTMHIFRTNIEQIYGDCPSYDGAPLAEGDPSGLLDGTLYTFLYKAYMEYGGIYKLCFGPKSFMVISDPVIMKHILQDNPFNYDKGVLAEILKPIMGKGLIPADPKTWLIRRRAIAPGFHKGWIDRMVSLFGEEVSKATKLFDDVAAAGSVVDVEERVGSLTLDIIGRAIFDYDFNSTVNESPVVKATIQLLKEAEHRSLTPLPYWNLPFAMDLIPRQVEFKKNIALLNDRLDACINKALANRKEEDVEALQERNYAEIENPSMLRFMVDMRDADITSGQLRDDLMTMLIAGHETTASVLTWVIFELAQQPALVARIQAEVDRYLPNADDLPTMDMLREMHFTRMCVSESLRLYPEPPLLIRRVLQDDTLPAGTGEGTRPTKLLRGTDLFLSGYNMQRSPLYWDNPDKFDPDRFTRKKESTIKGWAGFDPDKWVNKTLYPTESAADWAFLPFGGGPRKCVGDMFAMFEATYVLAVLMRRYEFNFAAPTATPEEVGTATGATIHTRNGLWMKLKRRK